MSVMKSLFAVEAALSLTALAIATYTMPALPMESSFDMNPAPVLEQQAQSSWQEELKDVIVTGTIVKSGAAFTLTDSNGNTYRLDSPERAGRFEGKPVTVTGKLEASSDLLHIETIEQLA